MSASVQFARISRPWTQWNYVLMQHSSSLRLSFHIYVAEFNKRDAFLTFHEVQSRTDVLYPTSFDISGFFNQFG